jgi:hypothetical protein
MTSQPITASGNPGALFRHAIIVATLAITTQPNADARRVSFCRALALGESVLTS